MADITLFAVLDFELHFASPAFLQSQLKIEDLNVCSMNLLIP